MEHPTRLLLPIGHLLGSIYYGDTPDSIRYGVRVGWQDVDLSPAEFLLWSCAHGDPAVTGEQVWTLAAAQRAAAEQGLTDPAEATEALLDKGLLREVALDTAEIAAFAAEHQVFPLLLGLGNTLDDPAGFRIGTVRGAVASVTLSTYTVWSRAQLAANLLDACAQLGAAEFTGPGGPTDATTIADGFLRVAHILLAVNALYFDVATGSRQEVIS